MDNIITIAGKTVSLKGKVFHASHERKIKGAVPRLSIRKPTQLTRREVEREFLRWGDVI